MERMLQIGQKLVARDGPPLIMAEVGVNHDGSLEKGMKLVEAASEPNLRRREIPVVQRPNAAGKRSRPGRLSKNRGNFRQ